MCLRALLGVVFDGCTTVVEPLYTNANCPKVLMCADAVNQWHASKRKYYEKVTTEIPENQDSSIYCSRRHEARERQHTRKDTGEEVRSSKNVPKEWTDQK